MSCARFARSAGAATAHRVDTRARALGANVTSTVSLGQAMASRRVPAMSSDLAALVGAEHVFTPGESSPYNTDASRRRGVVGRADAVVLPGTVEETAAVMRWCYEHDVPLVPRGGGTGLTGGAVPTEGGVVCSLERMRRVRELEPGLWRMYVEA